LPPRPTPASAATANPRKLERHADRSGDRALFPREAVQVHDGDLAAEQSAARRRRDGRDAVRAQHRNRFAVVVERHLRAQRRVEVEQFVGVAEPACAGIDQAGRRRGVDESGIDLGAGGVDHVRPDGTLTLAPTASMIPSRITIVPRSIAGFAIGKIFALVIATTPFVTGRGRAAAFCGCAATPLVARGTFALDALSSAFGPPAALCDDEVARFSPGRGVSVVVDVGARRSLRSAFASDSFSFASSVKRF
jgi:hypothetical protein